VGSAVTAAHQFGRRLMHIVDGGVDDRRMPADIGRETAVGGQSFSNRARRFQVSP
jgi:hypothetical protein